MTSEQFLEKVKKLHTIHGIPYSEMGKRMGITGQYISLMVNGRKPVTKNVLDKASECEMFKDADSITISRKDYEDILNFSEELRGAAALCLIQMKFGEFDYLSKPMTDEEKEQFFKKYGF